MLSCPSWPISGGPGFVIFLDIWELRKAAVPLSLPPVPLQQPVVPGFRAGRSGMWPGEGRPVPQGEDGPGWDLPCDPPEVRQSPAGRSRASGTGVPSFTFPRLSNGPCA